MGFKKSRNKLFLASELNGKKSSYHIGFGFIKMSSTDIGVPDDLQW